MQILVQDTLAVTVNNEASSESTWPEDWQDVRAAFESYIHSRYKHRYERQRMLREYVKLTQYFLVPPRMVTQENVTAVEKLLANESPGRSSLTHLYMMLISLNVWPIQFLPLSTSQYAVKKALEEYWQKFIDKFMIYMLEEGATRHTALVWRKWITIFLWWNGFSEDDILDPKTLPQTWQKFDVFLAQWLNVRICYPKIRQRAFAIFWNFAILQERIKAEPLHVERTSPAFLRFLKEPIRVLLQRTFPGISIIANRKKWIYTLRYALFIRGFAIGSPNRSITMTDEEIVALREILKKELFCDDTINKVSEAIRNMNAQPKGDKSNEN